jgi:hypothetical protein
MSEEKRFHDLVIRIAMKHDRENLMKDGYSSEEIDKADKHFHEVVFQSLRMIRENSGVYHNGETN